MKVVQSTLVRFLGRGLAACLLIWLTPATALRCSGQGTLHITFDGPPPQPPGTAFLMQKYEEAGMLFVPLGSVGFGRSGGGRAEFADNGTPYLISGLGSTLMFSFTNGTLFDMLSVDLAEFSTSVTQATVRFVGYRADGSVAITDLTTDGIVDGTAGPAADFETFQFSPQWSGLSRVEIPTYGWSLDNLVVIIPEPRTGALITLGAVIGALRWCKRRQHFI